MTLLLGAPQQPSACLPQQEIFPEEKGSNFLDRILNGHTGRVVKRIDIAARELQTRLRKRLICNNALCLTPSKDNMKDQRN